MAEDIRANKRFNFGFISLAVYSVDIFSHSIQFFLVAIVTCIAAEFAKRVRIMDNLINMENKKGKVSSLLTLMKIILTQIFLEFDKFSCKEMKLSAERYIQILYIRNEFAMRQNCQVAKTPLDQRMTASVKF